MAQQRPNSSTCARGRAAARRALVLAAALAATPVVSPAQDSQPTLELFPKQSIDSIRETSESARALEQDLQSVVDDLESQMALYQDSGCEGAVNDSGCQEITRQMASSYNRMLDLMADRLPEMKQNINVTRDTLRKRLAEELGYGRTGADLQDLLGQGGPGARGGDSQRTRPIGGGVRLSDRFEQYYRLVSQSGGGVPSALVGARIYLDLEETSDLIELTEQEIQRGRMLTNLSESFGQVTPAMEETISGVKTVVLGESAAGRSSQGMVPDSPRSEGDTGFCSEFDPSC